MPIPQIAAQIPVRTGRLTAHVAQMEASGQISGTIDFQPVDADGNAVGEAVVLDMADQISTDSDAVISIETVQQITALMETFRSKVDALAYAAPKA